MLGVCFCVWCLLCVVVPWVKNVHEDSVTELPKDFLKSVCNYFSYTKGQDPKSYYS